MAGAEADSPVVARKVKKESHIVKMRPREEMALAKQMPKGRKLVMIAKVSGVLLFAIGLEGIVTANWLMAASFLVMGTLVVMVPIRMKVMVCPKCRSNLPEGSAVCRECGAPVL